MFGEKPRSRVFLSYRRADLVSIDLLERIENQLLKIGYTEVFYDRNVEHGIQTASEFDRIIDSQLLETDLFVCVIGPKWQSLLDQAQAKQEQHTDFVVREISIALELELDVLPILLDGAPMPAAPQLPAAIKDFAFRNAAAATSPTVEADIAQDCKRILTEITASKLGEGWQSGYLALAIVAVLITGIIPNLIGALEYGPAWTAFASSYGGLFIWPAICLPFALIGFYHPTTSLLQALRGARRLSAKIRYAIPFVVSLILASLTLALEVSAPKLAPWEVRPLSIRDIESSILPEQDKEQLAPLFSLTTSPLAQHYDQTDQRRPNWLRSDVWPNGVIALLRHDWSETKDSPEIQKQRAQLQAASAYLLSKDFVVEEPALAFSLTRWSYVVGFFLLVFLALYAVTLAVFYTVVQIRRRDGYSTYKVPSENSVIALVYAFITLMFWTPMRLITVLDVNEKIYGAEAKSDPLTDALAWILILVAFLALVYGLLWRQKRTRIALYAMTGLVAGAISAIFVFVAPQEAAAAAASPRFYLVVAVPLALLLLGAWFLFDPHRVRFQELRARA